jgi:branched-chain amino acid transport system substrate-binding protein
LTTRASEIGKAAAVLAAARQPGGEATTLVGDGSLESDDMQNGFATAASPKPPVATFRAAVQAGQLDFAQVAKQVLDTQAATVFFSGHAPEGGLLLSALRTGGFGGRWIGGSLLDDPNFVRAGAGKVDGALYVTTAPLVKDIPAAASFAAAVRATTGQDPGTNALHAYDGARLLMRAIQQAIQADKRPSRARVCDALGQSGPFAGVLGNTAFDQRHELTAQRTYVFEVQNGAYPGKPVSGGLQ